MGQERKKDSFCCVSRRKRADFQKNDPRTSCAGWLEFLSHIGRNSRGMAASARGATVAPCSRVNDTWCSPGWCRHDPRQFLTPTPTWFPGITTAAVLTWQGVSAAKLATKSGSPKTICELGVGGFLTPPLSRIVSSLSFPGGQCWRTVSDTPFFASMVVSSQGFIGCVILWGSGDPMESFLLEKLLPQCCLQHQKVIPSPWPQDLSAYITDSMKNVQ